MSLSTAHLSYKPRFPSSFLINRQPPFLFCLIHKLKRSSAENIRKPETLAVELSLSAPSLSLFSLSSPAPCSGGGGGCAVWCVVIRSRFPLPFCSQIQIQI
ncbi:hypothetical protein F2Q69_00027306 [Brassica cretica]|uniref:Uncharacterized protein n=1 Tax=Brassica cretica TaxID=69181 RepID=A0A8S9S0E1_BRACR|nr:hypothetical protein F2Q69_00027306 [Brassica cretica]